MAAARRLMQRQSVLMEGDGGLCGGAQQEAS